MEEKKKKSSMFAKIESRDDALKVIKDASIGFFFIAVLQAGLGFFIAPSLMIDAVLYAILAGVLLKWKSRIAAVLLLLLAGGALVMTFLNTIGATAMGGSNIILGLVILWAAVRAVEATSRLHGEFAEESQ
ncbi:MAG: hypothetical protein K8R16_06645 [Anaerolineales bacterium]|nr:hypothetical protein [Anaerolineales bacterium]